MKKLYKNYDPEINSYLYSEDYLIYCIANILFRYGSYRHENIFARLKRSHPTLCSEMFFARFKCVVENNFLLQPKTRFILHDYQTELIKKVQSLVPTYQKLQRMGNKDLLPLAKKAYDDKNDDLLIVSAIVALNRPKDIAHFSSLYYNFLARQESVELLENTIKAIDSSYDTLPLIKLIDEKRVNEYLFFFDLNFLGDLKQKDRIALILAPRIEEYLPIFQGLHYDLKDRMSAKIDDIFSTFSPIELDILARRNGWVGDEETLEEIAKCYNLSRERIRQQEKKAMEYIHLRSSDLRVEYTFLFDALSEGESFFAREKLDAYVPLDLSNKLILLINDNPAINIKYSSAYKLIYNAKMTSLDDIIDSHLKRFGNIVLLSEIANPLEMRIVQKHYHERGAKFKRRGLPHSAFVLEIIDANFPRGYHISSKEDFEKFREEYNRKYNEVFDEENSRVITTALNNNGYMLIDRGRYLNWQFCPRPSAELLNKIANYIDSNPPVAYYNAMFDVFKPELTALGINNPFYLKGILDRYLQEYNSKRDYIISNPDQSGHQLIIEYMRTIPGVFTLDDLKKAFPVVNDAVFFNIFNKEEELIWLANKNFVYLDRLDYSEDTKKLFKAVIDYCLDVADEEMIVSNKLFAQMSDKHHKLIDDLKVASSHFNAFSVAKVLYPQEYYYQRPLISRVPIVYNSTDDIITNYARSLDRFNKKMVDEFSNKRNMRCIFDYGKFMVELSDEFVQIDVDEMVRKEKLHIESDVIQQVRDALEVYFMRHNRLKLSTFKDFHLLPDCPIKWNKYALKGVVESYLNDIYFVHQTDKYYHTSDYIIKAIK